MLVSNIEKYIIFLGKQTPPLPTHSAARNSDHVSQLVVGSRCTLEKELN